MFFFNVLTYFPITCTAVHIRLITLGDLEYSIELYLSLDVG